jgi:AcrR family transcriptional regulator
MVLFGTITVKKGSMVTSARSRRQDDGEGTAMRGRILDAAIAAFTERGYTRTSTLEIATRARVSKRELYALVGNKQEMLVACIRERARRLQVPADMPAPRDREALARVLASFGAQLVREVSDPSVVAVFRLAIAEAVHAPEVARVLDSIGRETGRRALQEVMAGAQSSGLLKGSPARLAEQFRGLLWGDLIVSLLLGVVDRPSPREVNARARDAAAAFLQLHPPSNDALEPGPFTQSANSLRSSPPGTSSVRIPR